jgi:hypothetical protein
MDKRPHVNYKPAPDMQIYRHIITVHTTEDVPLDTSALDIPGPSDAVIALVTEILETMTCDANSLCDLSSSADWGFFVSEVVDPDFEDRIAISVRDEQLLLQHLLDLLEIEFMTERVLRTFHWLFEANAITLLHALADHCAADLSRPPLRELFYTLCSFFPSPRHIDPILSLPAAALSDFLRHEVILELMLTQRDLLLTKLRDDLGNHSDFAVFEGLSLTADETAEFVALAVTRLAAADTSDRQLVCSIYRFLQPHAADRLDIIGGVVERLAAGVSALEKGEIVQFLAHVATIEDPAVVAAMIEAGVVPELCGMMNWQQPSLQNAAVGVLMILLDAHPEEVAARILDEDRDLALLEDICQMGLVEHADELYQAIKMVAGE